MKNRRAYASYAAILVLLAIFVMPPAPAHAGLIAAIDDADSASLPMDDAWFTHLSWLQKITVIIYAYDGLSFPIP